MSEVSEVERIKYLEKLEKGHMVDHRELEIEQWPVLERKGLNTIMPYKRAEAQGYFFPSNNEKPLT